MRIKQSDVWVLSILIDYRKSAGTTDILNNAFEIERLYRGISGMASQILPAEIYLIDVRLDGQIERQSVVIGGTILHVEQRTWNSYEKNNGFFIVTESKIDIEIHCNIVFDSHTRDSITMRLHYNLLFLYVN